MGGIDNDLAYPPAEPTNPHILDLLAAEHGISREAAISHAIALRDLLTCRLDHLVHDLTATAGPTLTRYARDVAQVVCGHLDWCTVTARYRHRDDATAPPTTFTITDTHPDHDCTTSPPYPSIAWWWDQLVT
jgi:hypothetical protein